MSTTPTEYMKAGCDKLTANMFPEVVSSHSGKACVQSAFSAMFPLAQLALASVSTSHDDILNAISMPDDSMIKKAFYAVTTAVKDSGDVVIKMTNKFNLNVGYSLTTLFHDDVTVNFVPTDVVNINFANKDNAVYEMNNWVGSQTDRTIRDLVDPSTLTVNTPAIILNAVYFKGSFDIGFDPDNTRNQEFYVDGVVKARVPMMHNSNTFKFGVSDELDATLLELPFTDKEASLVIILPNKKKGINTLMIRMTDPAILQKNINLMALNTVDVSLPKFSINTTSNLKKVMENINVSRLFTPGEAHIDKLIKEETNNTVFVKEAIQKAFIEVNEKGSKATVALSHAPEISQQPMTFRALENPDSVPEPKAVFMDEGRSANKSFVANHPFLFYVIEKTNNMVLFNGVFRVQ